MKSDEERLNELLAEEADKDPGRGEDRRVTVPVNPPPALVERAKKRLEQEKQNK